MRQLADFIKQGENFAVISHISPDGDTMGSAAALIYALEKLGKRAQWFCEGNIPAAFMKIEEIASLTKREKLKRFDIVICVDCSDEARLGSCAQLLKTIKRTAQLDHHRTNTFYAQVNAVYPHSAAGFLVMELLKELEIALDTHMARALFVSVSTDTGRLSHNGVTAEEVRQTAALYEYDIRQDELTGILFQTAALQKIRLRGRAIEHLATAFEGRVAYTYLDADDYSAFHAEQADSDDVVELCRSVEGAHIAFFIRQTEDGYKASLRCLPQYDVSAVCAAFGGGGHKLAAGCNLPGTRQQVLEQLLNALKEVLRA